jgi:hypothetical protein
MDAKRFDSLSRAVGRRRSRRGAVQTLATAALGAAAIRIGLSTVPAEAAQVEVERRFNCIAVGDACKGNDSQCCSGKCKGKKSSGGGRKRNRRDKSRCVAHDQGSCTADQDTCESGRVACGRGSNGGCLQTTGNAPFCGEVSRIGTGPPLLGCEICEKDEDCVNLNYGSGAACVVCESKCEAVNNKSTACAGAWD